MPLSPRQTYAAIAVAMGWSNDQVSRATGYNPNRISLLRNQDDDFKAKVAEFQEEIARRMLDGCDLVTRFNQEAPKAFETLAFLHKGASSETVRLGAAKDILDRAPISPKTLRINESNDRGIVIQLSEARTSAIKQALRDGDRTDVLDMIEGKDFKPVDDLRPIVVEEI